MPLKFDAAPSLQRREFYFIDPAEVRVDPAMNARKGGLDLQHVRSLARSFLEEGGQKQPVQIRKDGPQPVLVAGFHRHAAAMLVNTEIQPDRPILLKCVFAECNAADAFRDSIIENRRRRTTGAIDDAHNQQQLRQVYGWGDEQIAKLYDTTPAVLAKVASLLALPEQVQRKIAARQIPTNGALALVDLPADERDAALAAAVLPSGRVNGERIAAVARERKRDAGGKAARSYPEVKAAFEAIADDEHEPEETREFAKAFGKFAAGKVSVRQMRNAMLKAVGV